MTEVQPNNPKKIRLGEFHDAGAASAAAAASTAAAAGASAAARRMLQELSRKCTCWKCGQSAANPMAAKCGHCLCGACAEELRGGGGSGAGATGGAHVGVHCGVCAAMLRGEELKRDGATEKLLNAMKVLEEHISAQDSQPSLEMARCADCLSKASQATDPANPDAAAAAAASGAEAAAKRCEDLRGQLERLADDGDRGEAERRRAIAEASEELTAWKHRLDGMLTEWQTGAAEELNNIGQRAEQLLTQEAVSRGEARAAADELRRLLLNSPTDQATLRAAEARAADQVARLSGLVGGSFELSRRGDPTVLTGGFATLLAQSGLDLVVRPYAAALSRPEPRAARAHKTGGLEPWDLGLLTNTAGLWYSPDGQLRVGQPGGEAAPDEGAAAAAAAASATGNWRPLPSPCLIVNYKGFKTKRLHLFDSSLKEVASVRLQLKDGRLPGTIHVWNSRQFVITVDHSRCKICQFDLTGKLIRKVGGRGNGPSQFRQPMTAYVHDDLLYVVDSDNKRVQIFKADTLEPTGSLTHEGFSTDLHSVLATDSRIIVTDRDNAKAFVFDRESKRLLREVALGGKPFSLTADTDANLFVSLTNERKVHVYDPAMSHRLHVLAVARKSAQQRQTAGAAAGAAAAAAAASAADSLPGPSSSAGAEGGIGIADDDDDGEEEEEEEENSDSSSSSDAGGGGGFRGFLAGLKKMSGGGGSGGSSGKPPFIYGIAFDSAGKRLYVADTFCHAILAYQL